MDLEGDETSLGICWAAAASFLEWVGRGGGGVGVGRAVALKIVRTTMN